MQLQWLGRISYVRTVMCLVLDIQIYTDIYRYTPLNITRRKAESPLVWTICYNLHLI